MFKRKSYPDIPKLPLKRHLNTSMTYGFIYIFIAMSLSFFSSYQVQIKGLGINWYQDLTLLIIFASAHTLSFGLFIIAEHRVRVETNKENNMRIAAFVRSLYSVNVNSIADYLKKEEGSLALRYILIRDHFVAINMRNQESDSAENSQSEALDVANNIEELVEIEDLGSVEELGSSQENDALPKTIIAEK